MPIIDNFHDFIEKESIDVEVCRISKKYNGFESMVAIFSNNFTYCTAEKKSRVCVNLITDVRAATRCSFAFATDHCFYSECNADSFKTTGSYNNISIWPSNRKERKIILGWIEFCVTFFGFFLFSFICI